MSFERPTLGSARRELCPLKRRPRWSDRVISCPIRLLDAAILLIAAIRLSQRDRAVRVHEAFAQTTTLVATWWLEIPRLGHPQERRRSATE